MNNACEELIAQWLSSSRVEIEPSLLAHVLLYITRHPEAVLTIVNILSSAWTHQKDHYKCTELLAQITVHSGKTFNSSSVNAIVEFVCDRLPGNHPLIMNRFVDIINALVMIPPGSSFYDEHAARICQALFTHVKTKSLHHDARYKLLLSLEKMIENYILALRHPEMDFVGGFINLVDGEKDPRNLLKVFELVRLVITNFDISIHVEDLFDYAFCYFPITFTPPPNDPYGITTQQLKTALRECLSSTPYFANFATPLLIEKVIKTTGSAKSDAIETIGLCAPAYGPHALLPHVTELFKALSNEVYVARSSEMERISLATIHSVVSTLAGGICIADIRLPVEAAIRSLLDPCIEKLEHPELKDAKSAGHILCAAASAADPTCSAVTQTLVPILTRLFKTSDQPVRQKAIVDVFNAVLKTNRKLYGISSLPDNDTQHHIQSPLLPFKPQLLFAFTSSMNSSDVNVRHSALEGLHEMSSITNFLTSEEL
ncbi:Dos2-interacting transcription regulator of RNA-Pol-II-domain-containing protein [Dichotomocladium elegans]|nr:Dos2-interacting transcription regulator of RNA-Pol-II-domain-containing protein [Dichotomocladium elegans]